jgi:hypothetical protein
MVYFQTTNPNFCLFVGFEIENLTTVLVLFGGVGIIPPFGTFCSNFVYIFLFWYVTLRKIWQP